MAKLKIKEGSLEIDIIGSHNHRKGDDLDIIFVGPGARAYKFRSGEQVSLTEEEEYRLLDESEAGA